ncbi:MAG: TonB-dependent receptor, partial [Acidobacteriaceae bacterium]|nr:TonB-dependent receptor [Acidobacteriaceae bacterium]
MAGFQPLEAQTATGSISGTVRDPSNAPVMGATLVLTNTATNETRTTTSNNLGYYSFPLLPPAAYSLKIDQSGFRSFVVQKLTLDVAQALTQDVNLQIGNSSQTVTVTESGPQLETETSSLGQVLSNETIVDLPINGRNAYGFAQLVPGVRTPNLFTQVAYASYNDQFISINGSRVNANIFYLDGGINSEPGFNGPGIFPSIDLVQEYKVQTNNFSAEFGNTSGGVINVVTKSGTNQVHGSAYDFLRNDIFDANDFFANRAGVPISPLRFNPFGATLGGPVWIPKVYNGKDKTFFFFSYEGLRWVRSYTANGTYPTPLQRQGNFSQTFNQAGQLIRIFDPLTATSATGTRTQFPGNVIPANRFDPVAAALLAYTPLPTGPGNPVTGTNNYTVSASAPTNEDTFSIRGDQKLTDNQKLFLRWTTNVNLVHRPAIFPASAAPATPTVGTDTLHHQQATLNYSWVINPTTVLEASSSVVHYWLGRVNNGLNFDPTTLGFPSYFHQVNSNNCFPSVGITGMGIAINVPDTSSGAGFIGACNHTSQSYDSFLESANLTKVSGAHTFKMGGDWGSNRWTQRAGPSGSTFNFSSSFTQGPTPTAASSSAGLGFASFLLGTGDSGSINNVQPGQFIIYHFYGAYFQDDWKITPKLTLNLGLRYDFNAPWHEKHNRINSWDGTTPVQIGGLNLHGGLQFPGVNGLPTGQFDTNRDNFAPRFGFAYSPDTKTVVRGGFGIFFGPINGAAYTSNSTPNTGFTATTQWTSTVNGITPVSYLSNPFPNGLQAAPGSTQGLLTLLGQTIYTMDRGRVTPYSEQWNFGIQRTLPRGLLADISYAGSHGLHLFGPLNYDQLPDQYLSLGSDLRTLVPNPFFGIITSGPLSTATVQKAQLLRPYPQFNSVIATNNSYGDSIYHSLQIKVERRFANGFGMLLAYTYSKLIDDVLPSTANLGFAGETFSAGNIQDYYNRRNERSVADFDTPNYLTLNGNWELPFGKGKPFLSNSAVGNATLGGWQLNGILNYHTGQPLGLTTSSNTANNFGTALRPNYVGGNVMTPGPVEDKLNDYFNVSAFAVPAPYTLGNTGRLLPYLRGPNAFGLDISMFKNIAIYERLHMQFRAEAFNILNHPQFDLPNTVIGSATAGVISNQVNRPR